MIVDLHSDTIMQLWENGVGEDTLLHNSCNIDIERMERNNGHTQCFALYTPERNNKGLTAWQSMKGMHDVFLSETEKYSDRINVVRYADEIKPGSTNAILTIEGMWPTEGRDERVDEVLSWNPRLMTLTWNEVNEFAYPNSLDREIMNSGLTRKGFELVEKAMERDVIIDVSHLSDGGFWDLMDTKAKVVASHSNAREVCDHQRNLSDEMIRALSDHGGVMGLNFCISFLRKEFGNEVRMSRIRDMLSMLHHIHNMGGEDVLALGTDFDGIGGILEIDSVDKLYRLREAMEREFSPRVVDKFFSENALRVLSR